MEVLQIIISVVSIVIDIILIITMVRRWKK